MRVVDTFFFGEGLLAPLQTSKPENLPLSAVWDCLFTVIAITLHVWTLCPPSITWRHTIPRWLVPTWHGTYI